MNKTNPTQQDHGVSVPDTISRAPREGDKRNLAILFGGKSSEYEVSLQSAYSVLCHLDKKKYNPILVGITKQGRWFHFNGNPENILKNTWSAPEHCTPAHISPCRGHAGLLEQTQDCGHRLIPLDAAFPVLHGTYGEDGTVQGLLELAGIPIVGCGTLASALCMNKNMAHIVAQAMGVPVAKSVIYSMDTSMDSIKQDADTLGYPLFVKPVCAGSSFGVSKVDSKEHLSDAVKAAFVHDANILLEEAIDGFEVGCAIMGNGELVLGELDEVELADGFFDFTEKYNLITSKIHVPARVNTQMTQRIKETAAAIYCALGCKGFARVDMFLKPDGGIVFNEVNTIPGFTAHSRYPSMMHCAGIGFSELIDSLIETAVQA